MNPPTRQPHSSTCLPARSCQSDSARQRHSRSLLSGVPWSIAVDHPTHTIFRGTHDSVVETVLKLTNSISCMGLHTRINFGCGTDIRRGWTNVDVAPLPGVDIVHDLNQLPLPFESGTIEEIGCFDVIEHLDYIPFLKECHRILLPGGRLHISVPHFSACNNFDDPTHRHMFSTKTFRFFCRGTHEGRTRGSYYFDFLYSDLINFQVVFETDGFFVFNKPVQWIVNRSDRTRWAFDATCLSRLFPAMGIRLTLVK